MPTASKSALTGDNIIEEMSFLSKNPQPPSYFFETTHSAHHIYCFFKGSNRKGKCFSSFEKDCMTLAKVIQLNLERQFVIVSCPY